MIQETYNEVILEGILREILLEGQEPTVGEITRRFNSFLEEHDTALPLFNLDDAKVVKEERASAAKTNRTFEEIYRDLRVSYLEMFDLSKLSTGFVNRWRSELKALEGRIERVRGSIGDLLLLSEDIEGFFGFVSDIFNDVSLVDLLDSDGIVVDLLQHSIRLASGSAVATRLSLNSLRADQVRFVVLSRRYLQAVVNPPGAELVNAFNDSDAFWQHRVYTTSRLAPVTVEILVELAEEATTVNRIALQLHEASSASATQITPMLSTDGTNYSQLPIADVTKSVISIASWDFPSTEARYVKFIMSKQAPDNIDGSLYIYEFGAKDISFFEEQYSIEDTGRFYSTVHQILGGGSVPIEFNKLALEVCERVPEDTRLDYYLAVSNTPDFEVDDASWLAISPSTREDHIHPTVLGVGDLTAIEAEGVSLAYDPTATVLEDRNPSAAFELLQSLDLPAASFTATLRNRYILLSPEDRILDFQVAQDLVDLDTIELWRNVGEQGVTTLVRGAQRGWKYEEPYYLTTVEVENPSGLEINIGGQPLFIDETSRSGTYTLPFGIHHVRVHQDNWLNIPSGASGLSVLIANDPLFPYNHKHLIEGYVLNTSEENPYTGVDLFAGALMQQISVYDMLHNIPADDYGHFAIDLDTGDSGQVPALAPSHVFLVKASAGLADSTNERFRLSMRGIRQLFRYFRLRVDLSTEDPTVSPSLDGYKIKVGI